MCLISLSRLSGGENSRGKVPNVLAHSTDGSHEKHPSVDAEGSKQDLANQRVSWLWRMFCLLICHCFPRNSNLRRSLLIVQAKSVEQHNAFSEQQGFWLFAVVFR